MSDTTETETETGTNTDTTDEPSKAELHERVEQLESTVEKLMPSRRDALRMGVAGLAGAAGVGAASESAAASSGSAGQIGDSSNRPDLFAEPWTRTLLIQSGSAITRPDELSKPVGQAPTTSRPVRQQPISRHLQRRFLTYLTLAEAPPT